MWKVHNWLSTRKDGTESCEEFLEWCPGDIPGQNGSPAFPDWVPLEEWKEAGYIEELPELEAPPRPRKGATNGG